MSEEKTFPVIEKESVVAEEMPDNGVIDEQTVTEDEKEVVESEQTTAEDEKTEGAPKAKKTKKKRRKLHEVSEENDIKYRGPLSYRHLRIGGWVFMAFMVLSVIMAIGMKVNATYAASAETAQNVFGFLGELALPLFLVANFAVILNAKDGYKKMFITFGALIAVIYVVFLIVVNHYIVGILEAITGDREVSRSFIGELTIHLANSGYIAFNVFVDLFLCTALTYFLNYRPKKLFKGKLLIIFRLFAILPIAYEATSLVLKYLAGIGKIELSLWLCPLLSTKPPMLFVAFILMVIFIKIRERIFLSRGKTHKEYQEFLKTNVNSLHFSIVAAVIFLVVAFIDLVLFVGIPLYYIDPSAATEEAMFEPYNTAMQAIYAMGIGKSLSIVALIPVMFFFSYTKTYKKGKLPLDADIIIPAGGAVFVAIFAIEAAFQVACAVITAAKAGA